MTKCVVGRDRAEVRTRLERMLERERSDRSPSEYVRANGERYVIGTTNEAIARLHELERAGVDRVMLQHLDHEDLDMVDLLASSVRPALAESERLP